MADLSKSGAIERDIEQAITTLKKGAYLLKYGRRGKPKFCPFRLSQDESLLLWYSDKVEKQIVLSHVSRIIPGQRTAIFQRYPRPEKEYQSFSLIYNDRSLDLICKDKDEAEVWFVGLKSLISRGNNRKWRIDFKSDRASSDANSPHTRRNSPLRSSYDYSNSLQKDARDIQRVQIPPENPTCNTFGKAMSDVILYNSHQKSTFKPDSVGNSVNKSFLSGGADNLNGSLRVSTVDNFRVSLSSAVSASSQGSCHEDFDTHGDVFIWGEGTGDGNLGGGLHRNGCSPGINMDALLPKALELGVLFDVHNIACGAKHAALVTKKGDVFSWGEESGGRLGHGIEVDVTHPKLVDALGGMNVELVACGEYHTCAVTMSGDLYTWGDGTHNSGLLGHGSEISHWIPRKVSGPLEGLHVSSVSCGPWHTAVVTSTGQLFTFGDGTFGALGHEDITSISVPREVESLRGLRTTRAACGIWHTAAVVEVPVESSSSGNCLPGKLFTWGDGDKGRLGHGDHNARIVPVCVSALSELSFSRVACGHNITIALTTSGRVFAMGIPVYGQLGNPEADGKTPICIEGKLQNNFVEEIACGSYHVAVLTSKSEVYTWGKGANGQLGHGDIDDRNTPTLVNALKGKQVKSIMCGSNFSAAICLSQSVSTSDQPMCSGCRLPFGFRRKHHNCYNCGLFFCKACTCKKSLGANLAPNSKQPYRVCDDCFIKLKKSMEICSTSQFAKNRSGSISRNCCEVAEKSILDFKPQGHLSRVSSIESQSSSRRNKKSESNSSRVSPIPNGSGQWGSLYSSRPSNSTSGSSYKIFSASVPGSRIASRAESPVSRMPSPPLATTPIPTLAGLTSPNVVIDNAELANDALSQEIVNLRLQVEELTHKSELLESELEKTSKQLKEVVTIAGEETAKCKTSKQVITYLTAQLKDMANRGPEGAAENNKSDSIPTHTLNIANLATYENQSSGVTASHEPDFDGVPSNPMLNNRNKEATVGVEWVEQYEPGVYITLAMLGGGKDLKRVRFSRKRFSEKQAEVWWADHRARVYERYSIQAVEKSIIGAPQHHIQ